jgi:hypothetical protein
MTNRQRVRAVRHVADLAEVLIADFAEAADELAAIQEEIGDEAYLGTAQDKLASAKDSTEAALAALRHWLREAED